MKRLVDNANSPFMTIMPNFEFNNEGYKDAFNVFNRALGSFDPYFFYRGSWLRYNPYMVSNGRYIGLFTFFDPRGISPKIKQL